MALALNDEEILLKQTARTFLQEKAPVKALRELRDSADSTGFSGQLWKEMVDLGWAGIVVPEQFGGSGYSYLGLGIILEECGRTLAASPLVSTALLGATALRFGGSDEQKAAILPRVADGSLLVTLALEEGPRHAPEKITLPALKTADGKYCLDGKKHFVIDGHVADKFIVAARTSGRAGDRTGITLFMVDAGAAGVAATRVSMVDSRNAAQVAFSNVTVPAAAIVGKPDHGYELLEKVLDIARIGLAAEMLGSAQEAFDRTVSYLKERKQFDVPIGTFQALQHRAAKMFCEIETTKSVVMKALHAIDAEDPQMPLFASAAKAKAGETVRLVSNEAVQMFGGMGMTDEHEIGFFMKRARVAQQTFGDEIYHLDRFASLRGY